MRRIDLQLFGEYLVGPEAEAARQVLMGMGAQVRTITASSSEITKAVPDTTAATLKKIVAYQVPPTYKAAIISKQVFRLVFKDGSANDIDGDATLVFGARRAPSDTLSAKWTEASYSNWRGATLTDQQDQLRFQGQTIEFASGTNYALIGPQEFFEIWCYNNTTSLSNTTGYQLGFEVYLIPASFGG